MLYQSSLNKGGDFANQVISNIAQGNYGQVGSIKGADAQKAFTSYMGINPGGGSSYDNPQNTKLCSETTDKSIGYAIL